MKSSTLPANLTPMQMHHTVASMEKYGGGFCRALAQAWYVADPNNKLKIQAAFADLLANFGPTSIYYDHEDN